MKKIHVVAAVIEHSSRILCVQRPDKGPSYIAKKWEFPGGKVENGETEQDALKREIEEELNVKPSHLKYLTTVNHRYPDFEIKLVAYLCKADSGLIQLKEHIGQKWLKVDDLLDLDWAEADVPIVHEIKAILK